MITLDHLRRALHLPRFDAEAAHRRMAPASRRLNRAPEGMMPREAGVLVLVVPGQEGLEIVLTRRTDHLRGHSGQISFPGGRRDSADESFVATALRETCEELGLCDQQIEILGGLTDIYIPPSNYQVHPTVGALTSPPHFQPNPQEVAEVLTLPLRQLLDPRIKTLEEWEFSGVKVSVPYYTVHKQKVWGATAIMLSELEQRLREVVPSEFLPVQA